MPIMETIETSLSLGILEFKLKQKQNDYLVNLRYLFIILVQLKSSSVIYALEQELELSLELDRISLRNHYLD